IFTITKLPIMLKRVGAVLIFLTISVSVYAQTDQPVLYVCFDRGSDPDEYIIILDAVNLKQLGRIAVPSSNPYTIDLRSDKRIAFIAADPRFNGGVAIVDLVEKRLIKRMFEDKKVFDFRVGPDGFVYALLDSNQVALVNSQTFEAERFIQLQNLPLSINFSPDGKKAYVLAVDQLLLLDLTTYSIVKSISNIPPISGSAVISPDGRFLYIPDPGQISVIDIENFVMLDPLPGTNNTVALQVSPDSRTLYALDFGILGPPYGIVIDIPSRKIIKELNVFNSTRFFSLSSDGKVLYAN